MIYLTLEELLHVADRVVDKDVQVRDFGLLEASAARPQASAFGQDAYSTIHDKAASHTHSVARNHALVDGNKRLALGALIAFYGLNGFRLTFTNDEAYDLIVAIASGELDTVGDIAESLKNSTQPW